MVKVLVTGAGALLGQGIIRSLRASSLDTFIIAADPSPLATGLYWADRAQIVPMADDAGYLQQVADILAKERPDAVLVGTDVELAVFAKHRARLEDEYDTQVLVSDAEVVATANDKWLTVQFLRRNGFAYPLSCLPGDEASLIERVGFPLVVKPRQGARSIGLSVVHDRDGLTRALDNRDDLIIQEHVGTSDTEYTAGVLYFEGTCRASIVMRRDLRDGNTYRAFVEPFPELNSQVKALADKLGPYGPANFQFRLDDGQVKVFEINGRFSGTTPLRARAGFNEVEMSLRHILRGESVNQPRVKSLTLLRHWSETLVEPKHVVQQDKGPHS